MKRFKTLYTFAAFALATLGTCAHAGGTLVLKEDFGNAGALAGWYQVNNSIAPGTGWIQGSSGMFSAESGDPDTFIAASYLSALNGTGMVDNWLITPTLDLSGTTVLSMYTRHEKVEFFDANDTLQMLFAPGSGSGTDGFTLLGTVGGEMNYPDTWQKVGATLNVDGPGRFAFRYLGAADTLNYIGIDTLRVVTAVPEPSSYLMLGLGLAALGLARRKLLK
jgi:hypothetical protein